MELGMAGLARMGADMVRRLIAGSHRCMVFNRSPQKMKDLAKEKAALRNAAYLAAALLLFGWLHDLSH